MTSIVYHGLIQNKLCWVKCYATYWLAIVISNPSYIDDRWNRQFNCYRKQIEIKLNEERSTKRMTMQEETKYSNSRYTELRRLPK